MPRAITTAASTSITRTGVHQRCGRACRPDGTADHLGERPGDRVGARGRHGPGRRGRLLDGAHRWVRECRSGRRGCTTTGPGLGGEGGALEGGGGALVGLGVGVGVGVGIGAWVGLGVAGLARGGRRGRRRGVRGVPGGRCGAGDEGGRGEVLDRLAGEHGLHDRAPGGGGEVGPEVAGQEPVERLVALAAHVHHRGGDLRGVADEPRGGDVVVGVGGGAGLARGRATQGQARCGRCRP